MHMLKRGLGVAGLAGRAAGRVVACGGGGGASLAGIDRLGVTTGTISSFGSIIIRGVKYETDRATFNINDGPGNQSNLKVGQQVTIRWESLDNGVTRLAKAVSYDATLEGPVASIDQTTQTLVVLGQIVIIDAATSFDHEISPRDLGGLAVGDMVEVSGLIDGNGAIRATRIDMSDDTDFEVHGAVASLDTLDRTFIINGLTVDYDGVINPPTLSNGLFVEVEGSSFSAGILTATKVEIEDDHLSDADDGDDGELEGYITSFVSATNFAVAGIPVTTNGQTLYEDGVVGDLALNVKVEVEGEVNASGVLVARKVEFESGDDDAIEGKVEGDVTAVNTSAGTLTIAGITVTVTARTRFEDQTGVAGQSFGLADITVGNYVEVRGEPGTGAALTAVILERDSADDEGLLRGPASAIDGIAQTLSILGVPVITNGATQYRDDDNVINAATFFAAISAGSEVEVKFTQGGGTIVANVLELEDND